MNVIGQIETSILAAEKMALEIVEGHNHPAVLAKAIIDRLRDIRRDVPYVRTLHRDITG